MTKPISRRDAARHLVFASAAAFVPALLACKKSELTCVDTMGLSPDEVAARVNTLAYVDKSPYPDKLCSGCLQYQPAMQGQCGSCKVVKGPINPAGYCKSFAPKPAT